ncbi:MAG: carboxy terminal-processing peptidase [Gammaproteobacteria bacterium]|nr:carboxy terminal-processing peptidase [Gammaproteobacteria bacterium]
MNFGLVAQVFATTGESLSPLPKHRLSTMLITKIIDQSHYKHIQLDDQQSSEIFDEYLDALDPGHMILTQKDIDQFSAYRTALDDALLKGELAPAFKMYNTFNKRRIERANYALKLLDKHFDFAVKENFLFDRKDAGWPKDAKELNDIWRKRVKNDYLNLQLADKKKDELKETLEKRYTRIITVSNQTKAEDVYEVFINAYLRTLDPHTDYFSPRTTENFNINMSLSLEGIGAALQTVDEYTVVQRIIKGGPADLSGVLHAGDKIIGVGQGTKKVEDVIGWRLDDVVEKIRGPKDTVVQLHILPKEAGPDGSDQYVSIVRNKVKLEDQQVKKSILEIPGDKKTKKISVIEIPTFYMDFAASARGEKDYSSSTRDTKKIIEELKAENVDGIVIDLRRTGGGSLIEAVSLTGLFIKSGPVVQIRSSDGNIQLESDEDESVAYSGPLAVLVDRNSASASEIFAGAIQDYRRGTIIGEPTFGKGTVQSVLDLNRFIKSDDIKLGELKFTMAQFFRVNGDSTQHRGVIPDIIFPSTEADDDQGERSLKNALPFAHIQPAQITSTNQIPQNISQVKLRHEARIKTDSGFELLRNQDEIRQHFAGKKMVSLLESQREVDREQQQKQQNEILNKFRVSNGMKAVSVNDDFAADADRNNDKNKDLREKIQQIQLRETAAILMDVNDLPHVNLLTQKNTSAASNNQL